MFKSLSYSFKKTIVTLCCGTVFNEKLSIYFFAIELMATFKLDPMYLQIGWESNKCVLEGSMFLYSQ